MWKLSYADTCTEALGPGMRGIHMNYHPCPGIPAGGEGSDAGGGRGGGTGRGQGNE